MIFVFISLFCLDFAFGYIQDVLGLSLGCIQDVSWIQKYIPFLPTP